MSTSGSGGPECTAEVLGARWLGPRLLWASLSPSTSWGMILPWRLRGNPPWLHWPRTHGVHVWLSLSWQACWGDQAHLLQNQLRGITSWRHLMIPYLDESQLLIFKNLINSGREHCGHVWTAPYSLCSRPTLSSCPRRLTCRHALIWVE